MDNYKQNRDITGYITCYKSDPNNNKHEGKPKKGGGSQANPTRSESFQRTSGQKSQM
jgi:hypothetical protein